MFFAWIRNYRPSLGLRISVWYAVGIMASFVLIALFASWFTRKSGRLEDRAEILQEFRQDAARCRQSGSEEFRREVERGSPDIEVTLIRLARPDGGTALLVPAFGENETETRRAEEKLRQLPRQPGWQNIDGEAGHAAWQVYAEPMPDGDWLQVAKSDRRGRGTRRRLQAALLPIGTLALLICLVGAAGLTARALRPVRKLIDVTRAVIESGDLTARVPVTRASGGHELDELSALFNRMLARNEALIRAMGDALDNVAHDLRTPLTRLRGSAEASLRNPNATNATRDGALADTIEESERVLAMLRTIMDISEAEHGMMALHPESIELASLAEEAVGLYEYVAEERAVSLRVEVPPGLCLHADRTRLQQVLGNLLDNAVKYSTTGGEVLLRGGRAGVPAHETWLSVRDQGIGVSQSDLPRIWDRLYRGDHSRTTRGNGLGLSLVKAVVEAHGGRAEVKTAVGEGSTFTVYFPASLDVPCPPPAPPR